MQPIGQWVELREVWAGRTWELRRGIVLCDEPGIIAIYTPPATPAMIAASPAGERLRLPPQHWSLAEAATPADRHFVAVHSPGTQHSVLSIWDTSWKLLHYYINLESDLVRTDAGFEYEDHFLDVIVEPDLSVWRWKDEDELQEAVKRGLVTADQAAEFYAEGERAVERLVREATPPA